MVSRYNDTADYFALKESPQYHYRLLFCIVNLEDV